MIARIAKVASTFWACRCRSVRPAVLRPPRVSSEPGIRGRVCADDASPSYTVPDHRHRRQAQQQEDAAPLAVLHERRCAAPLSSPAPRPAERLGVERQNTRAVLPGSAMAIMVSHATIMDLTKAPSASLPGVRSQSGRRGADRGGQMRATPLRCRWRRPRRNPGGGRGHWDERPQPRAATKTRSSRAGRGPTNRNGRSTRTRRCVYGDGLSSPADFRLGRLVGWLSRGSSLGDGSCSMRLTSPARPASLLRGGAQLGAAHPRRR